MFDEPFSLTFRSFVALSVRVVSGTIPFDGAKVRLQMQDKANPVYRGLFHTLSSMVKQEGVTAPWKGVTAGIQRQCAFAPIRIGLYEPVRNFYMGADFKGDPPILMKIAAGLTTSAIGITFASVS